MLGRLRLSVLLLLLQTTALSATPSWLEASRGVAHEGWHLLPPDPGPGGGFVAKAKAPWAKREPQQQQQQQQQQQRGAAVQRQHSEFQPFGQSTPELEADRQANAFSAGSHGDPQDFGDEGEAMTKKALRESSKLDSSSDAVYFGAEPTEETSPEEPAGEAQPFSMPHEDFQAFGNENMAKTLTKSSIEESNKMIDQIEKAEVSETKRSVFRALTRLRGAATSAYDGVARSQVGNIEQYGADHQFRKEHAVKHLADKEGDVRKWAFPPPQQPKPEAKPEDEPEDKSEDKSEDKPEDKPDGEQVSLAAKGKESSTRTIGSAFWGDFFSANSGPVAP